MDFTSRLLSDSQVKLYRKNLKMPALLLDEKERSSRFITKNNWIEDPASFEKERSMVNPWTEQEKRVFLEMLATFGKDFAKISSFLSHKTTADCVEFYYKNHKSESFRGVKKQLDERKKWRCLSTNTYLVTSGKKWNPEPNAASHDMLGALSVAVAQSRGTARNQQKYAGRSAVPSYHNLKVSHGSYGSLERVGSRELSGFDKGAVGTCALAGLYSAYSSEAVSSCVTSSVSPPEKMNLLRTDRPLTPEVTQIIEEDTCSDEDCAELNSVDWTDEEKSMFIRALSLYGRDFTRISECVGTKSRNQCKNFFSKARKCLSLDQIHPGAGTGSTPMSDANGGRSDTDDACAAEMDSTICSTQSCSRMDVDFTQSVAETVDEGLVNVANTPLHTEADDELGGSNQGEVDGKVDELGSIVEAEKLHAEREEAQLKSVEGMDAAASKQSLVLPPSDVAELSGENESREVDKNISISIVGSVAETCIEGKQLCIEDEQLKSQITAEVQQIGVSEGQSSPVGMKRKVDFSQVLLLSETGSAERQQKICTNESDNVSFSLAAESNAKENDSYEAPKMNGCPNHSFNFSTGYRPLPLDILSCMQKRSQLSSKQGSTYSIPFSTALPDLSSICSEGSFQVSSQSSFNFKQHLNNLQTVSAVTDFYQQRLPRIKWNQVDQSSQVISGYPVQVMNQQETTKETNTIHENLILCESHSEGGLGSQLNQYFFSDIRSEKGKGSITSDQRPDMLFSRKNEGTSESQLRQCSMNAHRETEEQSTHRAGDVKLFGQILSNPSSQQKSVSSSQETDSRQRRSPRQDNLAAMKRSSSRLEGNSSMLLSRTNSIDQSSLEEVPLQSYGYWDGNRIQTGFSSLPDSATMLAAYQGPVPGMPVFPLKENVVSANGVASSHQQTYVRPLSANGKRLDSACLDGSPELQKRNGFERVSDFQQTGRTAMARLGVNIPGSSRGRFVGGSVVSDPVAALKMAAQLYTSEVDSWTRDVNGR